MRAYSPPPPPQPLPVCLQLSKMRNKVSLCCSSSDIRFVGHHLEPSSKSSSSDKKPVELFASSGGRRLLINSPSEKTNQQKHHQLMATYKEKQQPYLNHTFHSNQLIQWWQIIISRDEGSSKDEQANKKNLEAAMRTASNNNNNSSSKINLQIQNPSLIFNWPRLEIEKKLEIPKEYSRKSTMNLCHQLILILSLFSCISTTIFIIGDAHGFGANKTVVVRGSSRNNNHLLFLDDEPLLAAHPSFSPTRAPQQQRHLSSGGASAASGQRMVAPNPNPNFKPKQTTTSESSRDSVQHEPLAGSSTKFHRTNELDVFLDDMNHNELRTVASGQTIDDFFHSRRGSSSPSSSSLPVLAAAAAAATATAATNNRGLPGGGNDDDDDDRIGRQAANSASGKNARERRQQQVTDDADHLDAGSQSRQQVYSECALILQRTYVKNIDDPKHQLVPYGKTEQACISYKHIDKAVEQAKHQLKLRELSKKRKQQMGRKPQLQPPLPPFEIIHSTLEPPEDLLAAVGEINMAATQIIAEQFDLSNDELLNGLPLIDMSKTKFWPICPLLVRGQDIKCEITRFRTFTGHCNNLKHPTWGAAMTPFARYLPPVHPDGIWIPRKSIVTELTFDLPIGGGGGGGGGHSARLHDAGGGNNHDDEHEHEHDININHHNHHEQVPPPPHLSSMPYPVFHHDHVHHHQHIHHAAENNRLHSVGGEMASASSVQFVRHAHLEQQASSSSLGGGVRSDGGPQARSIQPPSMIVGERIIDAHYQQSHSPARPYSALATPLSSAGELNPTITTGEQQQLETSATIPIHNRKKSRTNVALELPSARLITSIVHKDIDLPHHDFTILFMSWGQLLDHDLTRAAQPPSSIKCCNQDGGPKHKLCLPIHVPPNDPFYGKFNVNCLEFRRSLAGVRPNCVLGPRVHQNAITAPIDANFVYGSSQALADALRLFKGGRLRDRNWFKREGLKPILPAQDMDPDVECIARPKDLFCFLAGDVRANEQTHLTVLHTLYMREHNRMADRLAILNPHWDDERIYQETRHIMAAGVQHVMINEYIPLLIGPKMTELYNLTAQPYDLQAGKHSYWHGYDPSVTTSVSNSFAAAAFRQGHTFVQGSVERYNKFHEFITSEKLRNLFKQPFLMYQPGVIDELTGGMINQPSQNYDPFISEDISGHLFQPPESQFGHDLAAINLQRGREQGLPGYNLFREWCGLPRAESFDQLEPYLTNHTAFHYSRLYKHVDDIDLWSGGVSERKLPGAAIGPTFACIIARQFSNTRRGDRFWYENPGLPSSFTPEQLAEIRKITLAKILCANSDDMPTIQHWALRMAHPVLNPRIPCHQLPELDLQFWQEE